MSNELLTQILYWLNLSIQSCFTWFSTFFVNNWYYFFLVVFLFTVVFRFYLYPIIGSGHNSGSDSVRKVD